MLFSGFIVLLCIFMTLVSIRYTTLSLYAYFNTSGYRLEIRSIRGYIFGFLCDCVDMFTWDFERRIENINKRAS